MKWTRSLACATLIGAIKAFRIALAYYLGLSSVDGSEGGANVKNRVFTLSVGYGFARR